MIYGSLGRVWNLGDGYDLSDGLFLGQIIGRWYRFEYVASSLSSTRNPALSVFLEYQGDVSARVKNVTFTRRITDSLAEPGHGYGSVVLQDDDGSFTQNGRSVIKQHDKIKIYAGWDSPADSGSDLLPRFTGIVKESVISTDGSELTLSIQDYGYLLKQAQTSGNWSEFNTPDLMVTELLSRLYLGTPEWAFQSGDHITYSLATDELSRRNYWKLIHGATLGINYVFWFNENGIMQLRPRHYTNDLELTLTDADMTWIRHERPGKLINEKSFAMGDAAPPPWSGFMAGDHVRWGQAQYTQKDDIGQGLYGVFANFEAEEMIQDWQSIYRFVRDSVELFKYPREIYNVRLPAQPYIDILDLVGVKSDKYGIHGDMEVIGIQENVTAGNYGQVLTLLSGRELR